MNVIYGLIVMLVAMPFCVVCAFAGGKGAVEECDVVFENATDNIRLAGSLSMPVLKAGARCPGVVLVSGSGANDRNEEMGGHKVFEALAEYLSGRGIAVLRYDDRGVGQSEGNYNTASLGEFYNDAMAAVGYLRSVANVGAVGVIGHSEGGFIGIEMAAYREIDFLITLAGGGKTGKEILLDQRRALLAANGAKEGIIERYIGYMEKAQEIALSCASESACVAGLRELFAGTPLAGEEEATAAQLCMAEMIGILQFDPYIMYPEIVCPTLIANGTLDVQVTCENARVMHEEMLKAGHKDVTLRVYEGKNHLFQDAVSGLPEEYATIDGNISEDVLAEIAVWIEERFGENGGN